MATYSLARSTRRASRRMAVTAQARCMALAALVAAFAAAPLAASAADTLRVGQSILSCICFAPVHIAEKTGVWQRQGLDVQMLTLRGDAQEMQALAAGSIDIGLGSGPGLGLVSKGVAVTANSLADMAVIMGPDSKATSLADLKDQRLGVSSAGSLTYWLVHKISQSQGWPADAITPVSLGDFDSNLAGLKSGAVQGIIFGVEVGYLLEKRQEGRMLTTLEKTVPNFISHAMFATNDTIANHPEALRRFVAGWYETVRWMRAHKDETVAIISDYTKFPSDVMAHTYDASMPAITDRGEFSEQALATLADSFIELEILTQKPDMAALINTGFLPKD